MEGLLLNLCSLLLNGKTRYLVVNLFGLKIPEATSDIRP